LKREQKKNLDSFKQELEKARNRFWKIYDKMIDAEQEKVEFT
jgi:hypothetical protein